ncbi:MAG TPA: sulfite exporter TauE/SafE family protein [Acidimicrobiia bacterium]
MTGLEQVAVFAAGMAAGAINAVVGSGTLITFPVLLAVGYPPVVANVSNTVGLAPGSASAAYGYRRELSGQAARLIRLGMASLSGGITGAVLLLVLPAGAFKAIVPALIALGCVLVMIQPALTRRLRRLSGPPPAHGGRWLLAGVYGAGIYGGYFGAAQGVLLIAILGLGLHEDLQRINAAKNVLAALVNLVAALVFVVSADVAWRPALLIALGSVLGGQIGATVGRRLSPVVLRGFIVLIGVVAMVKLLTD